MAVKAQSKIGVRWGLLTVRQQPVTNGHKNAFKLLAAPPFHQLLASSHVQEMWETFTICIYFPFFVSCVRRSLARLIISSLQAIWHGQMQKVRLANNCCWLVTTPVQWIHVHDKLGENATMLVLVDQHAADERIQLERYLQGTNVRSCMATVYLEIYVLCIYVRILWYVLYTCGENVVQINSMTTALSQIFVWICSEAS